MAMTRTINIIAKAGGLMFAVIVLHECVEWSGIWRQLRRERA